MQPPCERAIVWQKKLRYSPDLTHVATSPCGGCRTGEEGSPQVYNWLGVPRYGSVCEHIVLLKTATRPSLVHCRRLRQRVVARRHSGSRGIAAGLMLARDTSPPLPSSVGPAMVLAIASNAVCFWIVAAADASAMVPFSGSGTSRDEGDHKGWFVAMILGFALLWRLIADRFEVRGKTRTRHMMVQGPVTYKVSFSTEGENRSRFHVLPEQQFGAWQDRG